jgi:hypothetical protein
MLAYLVELVFHPDTFFERVSKERVNLIPPLVIVGAGALFFAIVNVVFLAFPTRYGYSIPVLPSGGVFRDMLLAHIVTSVIMPLFVWVLFSVIFYTVSRSTGGTGSFTATIQNVGYGMLPWTLSVLIPFFAILYRLLTYTGGPVIGGYSGIWFLPQIYCSLPLLGIMVWSFYLWMHAVRHTHSITVEKSAIITGVPVAIFLIVTIPIVWYFEMLFS